MVRFNPVLQVRGPAVSSPVPKPSLQTLYEPFTHFLCLPNYHLEVFEITRNQRIEMRNEMNSVSRQGPNLTMKYMPVDEHEVPASSSARANPPIEYVTDNGFSIVRLSEIEPFTMDSKGECHFMLRQPDGEESDVSVGFVDSAIAQVQSQRQILLSDNSDFWLTLAEQHLAAYVWNNNQSPAGGHLVVSQLASDDLVLAARWRD